MPFFFEGLLPGEPTASNTAVSENNEIKQFLGTREGLDLAKAFMKIKNVKIRRKIVALVVDLEQSRNGPSPR